MKNKSTFLQILSILFVISVIVIGCKRDSLNDTDIKINPKDGFCITHSFENNEWTFPKIDDGIDKELHLSGTFPNQQDFYKLSVIVDFYEDIPTETLPLVITTTSPDGNSMQSTSVLVEFTDEETVTELSKENGRVLKRSNKIIYPSKQFSEEGAYQFTIYSKYSKMSLPGVKSLRVVAQKVDK